MNKKDYQYIIGIDPGVTTGFAIWNVKLQKLVVVESCKIHNALLRIGYYAENNIDVFVRVEDARLRKWFGNAGREKLQGAGSIKRDCKIWEDYLKDRLVDFEMVKPQAGGTKWDSATFKARTGWADPTNEHSRDAGILCYKFA